jgi:hypothetical protein
MFSQECLLLARYQDVSVSVAQPLTEDVAVRPSPEPTVAHKPTQPTNLVRFSNLVVAVGLVTTAVPALATLNVDSTRLMYRLLAICGVGMLMTFLRHARSVGRHTPTLLNVAVFGFFASILAAHLVHPSDQLGRVLLNVIVATTAAVATQSVVTSGSSGRLVRSVLLFLIIQTVISAGQIYQNGPVGRGVFDETEGGFRRVGGTLSPSGTLGHANQLGIYAVVAVAIVVALSVHKSLGVVDRFLTVLATVFGSALVGLSMCRSAFVSIAILVLMCVGSTHRKRTAPLLVAIVLTMGAVGVMRLDSWTHRTNSSLAGAEKAGSGRLALNRQAVAIWKLDPLFGVGPGSYLQALDTHSEIKKMSNETLVVHNVWLYVLAALGAVGAALFTALGLAIARRCVKGRTWGLGLLALVAPLLLLDVALFSTKGLLWLGTVIGVALGFGEPVQNA